MDYYSIHGMEQISAPIYIICIIRYNTNKICVLMSSCKCDKPQYIPLLNSADIIE